MNSPLTVVGIGAATTAGGLAVGAVAPIDWGGVAQAITALGTLIVAAGTVITALMQARQKKDIEDTKAAAKETKTAIEETRDVMKETKAAVDGMTTKLVDAKVAEATAQATLDEQASQRNIKGMEDAATLKERNRADAARAPTADVAGPVPVEVTNPEGAALTVKTDDKT